MVSSKLSCSRISKQKFIFLSKSKLARQNYLSEKYWKFVRACHEHLKNQKYIFIDFVSKLIGVIEEDADQSEEMMSSLMTTSTGSNVTIIEQGADSVQLNF